MDRNEPVNLDLKKVILYKTGLGYFEKHGKVDLNKINRINLSFLAKNMNDLLKTFSINKVRGNFSISGISYESEQSNAEKLLEDSIIKLPEDDVMDRLLSQLRGMKISFSTYDQQVIGVVVGLQDAEKPIRNNPADTLDEQKLLVKLLKNGTQGMIKSYNVKDIQDLEILEPEAKEDFNFFLDVIGLSKKEKNRTISVYFNGEGNAKFQISFLQEVPAWKTSYRIFIKGNDDADDPKKANSELNADEHPDNLGTLKILFQGWAILDNVLDEDWDNVNLRLVSGIPISFKYDSYSPLFIERPVVKRDDDLNVSKKSVAHQTSPKGRGGDGGRRASGMEGGEVSANQKDIVKKIAESNKLEGPGFQYVIPTPVKVKRNQSSLIPIIQAEAEAHLIYVYNQNAHKDFPMATLEFHNTTDYELVSGPVSIFRNNIFEGEAVIPYLDKDKTHWIPFAVHQGIEISKDTKETRETNHEISIDNEVWQKYYKTKKTTYFIKNISDEPKTLLLEHPKSYGYKLYDSPDFHEKTDANYRFKIQLAGKEKKTYEINERRLYSERTRFDHVNKDLIDVWLSKNLISDKEHNFLLTLLQYKEQTEELKGKIERLKSKKQEISKEHDRIRQNLEVLGGSRAEKKLRKRYLNKFEDQEALIESYDKEIDSFHQKMKEIVERVKIFVKDQKDMDINLRL